MRATPGAQSLYILQQTLPWGHTADLTGSASVNLSWTVFDGGARRNRVALAEAHVREAEARVAAAHDQIEDQAWTAYTNLNTAFHQRDAATALLAAATQSYSAGLRQKTWSFADGPEVDLSATFR